MSVQILDKSFNVYYISVNKRNVMLNNIRNLGLDISINNKLYGNSDFAYDVNGTLFAAVHRYIIDIKRFV